MVVRGGYGIFYDQVFQNLTLFSQQQSNATLYQTVLDLSNNAVGVGELARFRYGVDPLPTPPPGTTTTSLAVGGTGRIIPPDMRDPYIQKASIGFDREFAGNWAISSDYVHTLGIHEFRVLNVNPRMRTVCDPAYGGSPIAAPCVSGTGSRYFDRALVEAGIGAGRFA